MQEVVNRAKELLADGTVARVIGWKAGDLRKLWRISCITDSAGPI